MVQYLVVNEKKDSYEEKFKIFTDLKKACEYFWDIGYKYCPYKSINTYPGTANIYSGRDIDIKLITLTINTEIYTETKAEIMNKETINAAHINAIKTKDVVAKALFSTFKGALDNELKNGSKLSEKEIIQNIAKKFTDNAKIMNTEDALKEIELLKPYLPEELEPQLYDEAVKHVVENNLELAEQIQQGKANSGKLVGLVMAYLKTTYPGIGVNPNTVKELCNLLVA